MVSVGSLTAELVVVERETTPMGSTGNDVFVPTGSGSVIGSGGGEPAPGERPSLLTAPATGLTTISAIVMKSTRIAHLPDDMMYQPLLLMHDISQYIYLIVFVNA